MGIAMQEEIRHSVSAFRLAKALLFLLLFSCGGVSAAQENAEDALFWRISQDDRFAGYILGTIHSEDPRVLDFSQSFIQQLLSCQVFAMEMVPDLQTLRRLGEFMHYSQPDKQKQLLGVERAENVMQALSAYSVPDGWKSRMKVWAVMMTLSVPPSETGLFMDLSISLRSEGAGLEVVGLETLEQQLSFLQDMPLDYQLVLLDNALRDYHQISKTHKLMVDRYLDGGLSALWQLLEDQLAPLDTGIREYFVDRGIKERNRKMVKTLLPRLASKSVFVAIGSLHLHGEDGVLKLLQEQGYELQPLPLPFNQTSFSE